MIFEWKLVVIFLILMIIGFWYKRWRLSNEKKEQVKTYELVKEYLLNNSSLASSKKPLMWIHIPYDINARKWKDFYTRNTTDVNKPYLYLTIKSIVDKCGDSFNICLISDETFGKIIPGWTIDLNYISEPSKLQLRTLALARTLYYYGGVMVPPSLLCFNDLANVQYNALSSGKDAFVGEFIDRTVTSSETVYSPNPLLLLGCNKKSEVMNEYCNYLEQLISRDYTNEWKFLGECSQWWSRMILENRSGILDSETLGVELPNNTPMTIEKLLGSTYYNLSPKAVALYIPEDEITKRTNYQWFERQCPKQVLEGNCLVSVYMLAALS